LEPGVFGDFDEDGLPFTDENGEPLSKSKRKKLKKKLAKHTLAFEKYHSQS